MKRYDAIIIGAGPAGLMAARELAKSNIEYLIIDSKHKTGYPLRCAEITREETFSELFDHTNYSFIKNRISNVSFQIKNTQKLMKKNMVMLDKQEFLEWLSTPIKGNLQLGTRFEDVSRVNDFSEIITNKGVFQAKLAIFANGTDFRIQRKFGLLRKDAELIPCVGGLFRNQTLSRDTAYFFLDDESCVGSWVFPKEEDVVNAGSGIFLKDKGRKRQDIKDAFKKSMTDFAIPLEGEPTFGGSYVTNGPIDKTYSDHVLFCGDSAGQVFGGIGEGIYFSLKAGQIAGKTAIESIRYNQFSSKFLKKYEIKWRESFGHQMDAGVIFATVLFFLMRHHLVHKMLEMTKPKEIHDIWIKGNVSSRIRLFHILLRLLGCSPKR